MKSRPFLVYLTIFVKSCIIKKIVFTKKTIYEKNCNYSHHGIVYD